MKRVPVAATIVVALAVLTMIRLGVWQLHRLHEKEALLARYAVNATLPPIVLDAPAMLTDQTVFRRVHTTCRQVLGWTIEGGRAANGQSGWRHLARCRTGAEGPGIVVDAGVSSSDKPPGGWRGGPVAGRVTWVPDHGSLLGRMLGQVPPRVPMLVAETAAPGLAPSAPPDPSDVPNNHLAYAVQWFLFAGVALVIYGVALARRRRPVAPERPRR